MKYIVTSAEAAKLLKKLQEEKAMLVENERQSSIFHAALGEDIESVRPAYDYEETQQALKKYDKKIRLVKHAINQFNTSQEVGDTGMTIDQVLVYIPQLTELRAKLFGLQARLPKMRDNVMGMGSNSIIDYVYTNYSVEEAKEDFIKISDELRALQAALDLVNTTVTMEFELPD